MCLTHDVIYGLPVETYGWINSDLVLGSSVSSAVLHQDHWLNSCSLHRRQDQLFALTRSVYTPNQLSKIKIVYKSQPRSTIRGLFRSIRDLSIHATIAWSHQRSPQPSVVSWHLTPCVLSLSASCVSWCPRGSLKRVFVPMTSWTWLSSTQLDTWTCSPASRTSSQGKTPCFWPLTPNISCIWGRFSTQHRLLSSDWQSGSDSWQRNANCRQRPSKTGQWGAPWGPKHDGTVGEGGEAGNQ